MAYRGEGVKGKRSTPITAWSKEEKIKRSAISLWGASKYSHEPSVFVANVVRPVASALADALDGRTVEASRLREYAETHFTSGTESLRKVEQARKAYRGVALNTNALYEFATRTDTDRGFIARAILTLDEGSETYVEPNAALMTREAIPQKRGDSEIIKTQIKYLAYMALGEVAIMPRSSPSGEEQNAA